MDVPGIERSRSHNYMVSGQHRRCKQSERTLLGTTVAFLASILRSHHMQPTALLLTIDEGSQVFHGPNVIEVRHLFWSDLLHDLCSELLESFGVQT